MNTKLGVENRTWATWTKNKTGSPAWEALVLLTSVFIWERFQVFEDLLAQNLI